MTKRSTARPVPKPAEVPAIPARLAYDEREAAALLCVSPRTLYSMRRAGRIAYVPEGAKILYPRSAIEAYLAAHAVRESGQTDNPEATNVAGADTPVNADGPCQGAAPRGPNSDCNTQTPYHEPSPGGK